MSTPYHAKYLAYELTKRCPSGSVEALAASLADAEVDLNPHQIDAALFAFKSPLSKGAILADEVGLGKTIEAGLVIAQRWAERRRKILVIVPSNLRKQWSQELQDKFFLPSNILETKSFNAEIKAGNLNPFDTDSVVLTSYQFARSKDSYIKHVPWDLVVIDEAHRLRNVYKTGNKIARAIKEAVSEAPKILLTATPLQNSILELYGLVSIIDDYVFGDIKSFKRQYSHLTGDDNLSELRERVRTITTRTLRRQVLEYVRYTARHAIVQEFFPTDAEQRLYDLVSEYLQKPDLFALPNRQRKLMTLILRKLLASSTFAISSTLHALASRLELSAKEAQAVSDAPEEVGQNYEELDELQDEWTEDESDEPAAETPKISPEQRAAMLEEVQQLREFSELARSIVRNSKGEALLTALRRGMESAKSKGSQEKAIIFTESTKTQSYLNEILQSSDYAGRVVLFNGSNTDPKSKDIYAAWLERHKGTDRISGSPTADKRAAIVEYFRDEAAIMIATEAAAEGINLQFCSLVVNYDLPWNPQRIEQRIGRCHRYGQKHDVVVVNFLNKNNAADQRVYELLAEKFKLFDGVFGASDEVLGAIGSGVDFEKRIAEIYQRCRTEEEISSCFDALQNELEADISEQLAATRQKLLDNFDEEVRERLKVSLEESNQVLSKVEQQLWQLTRFYLKDYAEFSDEERSFVLRRNPFPAEAIHSGPYRFGKQVEEANRYRVGHPLAQGVIEACKALPTEGAELIFRYSEPKRNIASIASLVGKSGVLRVSLLTLSSFQEEDHLLLSAVTLDGHELDEEQCRRLISLDGEVETRSHACDQSLDDAVNQMEARQMSKAIADQADRNAVAFDNEMSKLDAWADDVKSALEDEIKELDREIREAKREAKMISDLEKKVELHRRIKEFEQRRSDRRRSLFESQDQIDRRKEELLAETEARLQQGQMKQQLFTVSWQIL